MKADYTKPLLAVEVFSSTQTTARDCADNIPINMDDPTKCVWDLGGGMTVFVVDVNCKIDGENMGVGCYNNPSEGNYIFRS